MKMIYILLFAFCSTISYSQTWVERIGSISGGGNITLEYTVITKDQFDRLIQQNASTNGFCRINYIDVLEIRNRPLVSGTRPVLNGFYYLLARTRGRLAESRSGTTLIYGHSNSGRMELEFYNLAMLQGDVRVNSNEYTNRWNQFVGWVNSAQARYHFEEGERARSAGDYDTAIIEFTNAINLDPTITGRVFSAYDNLASAYFSRGCVYFYRGYDGGGITDYNRALADFNKSLSIRYNDSIVLQYRASLYHLIGDFAKAIADYRTLLNMGIYGEEEIRRNLNLAHRRRPFPSDSIVLSRW